MGHSHQHGLAELVPGVLGRKGDRVHVLQRCQSDTGGNAYPAAPASSHTITGLSPGEYEVHVRARYDDNGNGPFKKSAKVVVAGSAQQKETTPTPEPTAEPTPEPTAEPTPQPTAEPAVPPETITGLTLTSSGPGRLFISWNESSPAPTEYRLNWAPVDNPFPSWNSNQGGNLWISGTRYDLSSVVTAGTTYKLQMVALYKDAADNEWAGPWSSVITGRVSAEPPTAPTNLGISSNDSNGYTISWTAPEHVALTGYRISRGASAGALTTLVENTGAMDVAYTDSTTTASSTYHYAVTALSLDGDSPQSPTISTTAALPPTPVTPVVDGAPSSPAGLAGTLNGTCGVTLSWTDPDDDAITGYRILRGPNALTMQVIAENTGDASVSYTDSAPATNQTHVYAVQARNAAGLSQLSNTSSVATLSASTGLTLTPSSIPEITLSWNAPPSSAITGYRIQRGTSSDALVTFRNSTPTNSTNYTDGSVRTATTYYYAINALGPNSEGPPSTINSVTTSSPSVTSNLRNAVIILDGDVPTTSQTRDHGDPSLISTINQFHHGYYDIRKHSDRTEQRAQEFTTGNHANGYLFESVTIYAKQHPDFGHTNSSNQHQRKRRNRPQHRTPHTDRPGRLFRTLRHHEYQQVQIHVFRSPRHVPGPDNHLLRDHQRQRRPLPSFRHRFQPNGFRLRRRLDPRRMTTSTRAPSPATPNGTAIPSN